MNSLSIWYVIYNKIYKDNVKHDIFFAIVFHYIKIMTYSDSNILNTLYRCITILPTLCAGYRVCNIQVLLH